MKRYMRGRFLGKGGFAKCYEITDMDTKEVFAGKVVPKSMLLKPHQKEKMSTEIAIHKSLDNLHVVGFHGFFEDDDFVYVVLEICRRRVRTIQHNRERAFWKQTVNGRYSCHCPIDAQIVYLFKDTHTLRFTALFTRLMSCCFYIWNLNRLFSHSSPQVDFKLEEVTSVDFVSRRRSQTLF